MGTITPCLYAALASANGITGTSIIINVYAWAEDVKLHAPTTKLALQSSEFDYKPSQIASAVTDSARSLSRIPMIGPYAKATSMVASGMSKVASALGFTNVPNMDSVNAFKNLPFPHNSTCEVSIPIDRAAVDPKNEVCLDPRTVGLDGTDELSLAYIAGRESWLGNAILSSTDAVDALTLVSAVTPSLFFTVNPADNSKPLQYTPMAYVANMFKYWRGDIIFRFKFICTRFHKGRVRVTFDPTNNIATSVPDYTTVFNEIVDIGAEQDLEVRVPYSQATTFLALNMASTYYNFSGTSVGLDSSCNGMLTMRVVNPLSGPVATTAIPVMIFVRAADNIEYANPINRNRGTVLSPYALQSKEVNYPILPRQVVAGNEGTTGDPNKYLTHFGECIKSFRPLIHRSTRQYSLYTQPSLNTATANLWWHYTSRRLKYGGYSANAYWTANKQLTVGTTKYNYIQNTIPHLVSLLFVGQRGSITHTYNLDRQSNNGQLNVGQLLLLKNDFAINPAVDFNTGATTTSTTASVVSQFAQNGLFESANGIALTDQRGQPAISMNFPYYSPYNFQFTNPAYADKGSSVDGTDTDNILLEWTTPANTVIGTFTLHAWSNYGPDYNFFFFLNCPSMFFHFVAVGA